MSTTGDLINLLDDPTDAPGFDQAADTLLRTTHDALASELGHAYAVLRRLASARSVDWSSVQDSAVDAAPDVRDWWLGALERMPGGADERLQGLAPGESGTVHHGT